MSEDKTRPAPSSVTPLDAPPEPHELWCGYAQVPSPEPHILVRTGQCARCGARIQKPRNPIETGTNAPPGMSGPDGSVPRPEVAETPGPVTLLDVLHAEVDAQEAALENEDDTER